MPTTIGNLKDVISRYMGRTAAADLTVDGFDIGIFGINAARRKLERMVDLRYSEVRGDLSIATGGTLLTAATNVPTGGVKRVVDIELPIAASEYVPIEFLTEREWRDRVRRHVGRQAYSAAATLVSLGIVQTNPLAYQRGQTIFLIPAADFTFPVACKINVIAFLTDYTANADEDFLTRWAPEYLQWEALLECNKYFRRFATKEMEATIDEDKIKGYRDEALRSVMAWNASIDLDTSTPPGTTDSPRASG